MSATIQFADFRDMAMYESHSQFGDWTDPLPVIDAESGLMSHQSVEPYKRDHGGRRQAADRVQRRLAQNREAARKSRLRKKAYVQQLESSHLKLAKLEQDLNHTKQQALCKNSALDANLGFAGNVNTRIAAFEREYANWLEEQHRNSCLIRNALQANASDVELRVVVDGSLNHYYSLFHMKAEVAKADVFYLISGTWKTSVERFFLWIGGFRPSELLNVVVPLLDPLTDQQTADINKLRHSSQQAEDALSQGVEKLHQTLAQAVTADGLRGNIYSPEIASAIEELEALEGFVNKADHLREHTIQLMSRIFTPRQAARALLALGEYLTRLRALNSLWAFRP